MQENFPALFAILADESVGTSKQKGGWGHRNCRKKSLMVKDHHQLIMCIVVYVY
jgi:hypothetical protein